MIREIRLRAIATSSQLRQRDRAAVYLQGRLKCLPLHAATVSELPELRLKLLDWQHDLAHIPSFDRLLHSLEREGDFRLTLWTRDWLTGVQSAYELLNRYQRLLPLPFGTGVETSSASRLLELHTLLHPLTKGAAEQERVERLDCFRWVHRLEAFPSEQLQVAALFGGGVGSDDAGTLSDARDLTFFCTGSWQFLAEQGPFATWLEVRSRLARMSEAALCLALMTRQPPEVSHMLEVTLQERSGHAVA